MGGEKLALYSMPVLLIGSPPRGRGKGPRNVFSSFAMRITPAWAGKRGPGPVKLGRCRDHPRMGGEKLHLRMPFSTSLGSPPHGRGKVIDSLLDCPQRGITPA